jgi:hypothetical protein
MVGIFHLNEEGNGASVCGKASTEDRQQPFYHVSPNQPVNGWQVGGVRGINRWLMANKL